jgi:hypothetical protein
MVRPTPPKPCCGNTTHAEISLREGKVIGAVKTRAAKARAETVAAGAEAVAAGAEARVTPADVAAIAAGADAIPRAAKDRSNARTASLLMTLSFIDDPITPRRRTYRISFKTGDPAVETTKYR